MSMPTEAKEFVRTDFRAPEGTWFLEKRREARFPTNDPAEVQIPAIDVSRRPATVLNVSRSGMRLELHRPVSRGVEIKITLTGLVLFGEVRYCRRTGDVYHAGVLIRNMVYAQRPDQHVNDDDLGMYVVGKGLAASELIRLRDHLIRCESCRNRLKEMDAMLNPKRKK